MKRYFLPSSPSVFVGRSAELDRFLTGASSVRLLLIYGVAGIGKTSFLLRAGEQLASQHGARLAHVSCRPGDAITSIARSAIDQLGLAERSGPGDDLDRLVASLRQSPLILCIDDAHRLGDATIAEDLVALANAQLPLWICLASRQALPLSPRAIDHQVLRLAGLSVGEMRGLWDQLVDLYGPAASSFDDVLRRCAGNPLLFKQAFADPLTPPPEDPLDLAQLPREALSLLAELCVFRAATPIAALVGERSQEETLRWLGFLTRRFLVDVRGSSFVVHDLVREMVPRSPLAPGVVEHRRALDYYRSQVAPTDPVTPATLELLHHALGCHDDALAETILRAHLSQPSSVLPPSVRVDHELSEALANLATRRPLPLPLQLEKIRLEARHGDAPAALRRLQPIVEATSDDPFVAFVLGEVAFLAGDFDLAAGSLTRAFADVRLILPARLWALLLYGEICRVLGQGDAALDAYAAQRELIAACGPVGDALVEAMHAALAWDYDDPWRCLEHSESAHRHLALSGLSLPSFRLFSAVGRSARIRLGAPPEPGDSILEPFDESPLFRVLMNILRVIDLHNLGRYAEAHPLVRSILASSLGSHPSVVLVGTFNACLLRAALEAPEAVLDEVDAASRESQRRRQPLHHLRYEALASELLVASDQHARALRRALAALAIGEQPRLAVAWLHDVADLARAHLGEAGTPASDARDVRDADGARRTLIVLEAALLRGQVAAVDGRAGELARLCARNGWRWIACRARILEAETHFHRGRFREAAARLPELRKEAREQSYVNDELHAALLEAAVHRAAGDIESATRALTELSERTCARGARRQAVALRAVLARLAGDTATHVNWTLPRRLYLDVPLTLRLLRDGGEWQLATAQLAHADPQQTRLWVDLARQQIAIDGRLHDMRRRETLLPLIRALLVAPDMRLSAGELFAQAWGSEYHMLKHRGRLTMAIARLRKMLGSELIVGGRDSYALTPAGAWVLVEPADPAPLAAY